MYDVLKRKYLRSNIKMYNFHKLIYSYLKMSYFNNDVFLMTCFHEQCLKSELLMLSYAYFLIS